MPFGHTARHGDAVHGPGMEWKEVEYDEAAHHAWNPDEVGVLQGNLSLRSDSSELARAKPAPSKMLGRRRSVARSCA